MAWNQVTPCAPIAKNPPHGGECSDRYQDPPAVGPVFHTETNSVVIALVKVFKLIKASIVGRVNLLIDDLVGQLSIRKVAANAPTLYVSGRKATHRIGALRSNLWSKESGRDDGAIGLMIYDGILGVHRWVLAISIVICFLTILPCCSEQRLDSSRRGREGYNYKRYPQTQASHRNLPS
jgi:hypothetical protein